MADTQACQGPVTRNFSCYCGWEVAIFQRHGSSPVKLLVGLERKKTPEAFWSLTPNHTFALGRQPKVKASMPNA